MKTFLLAAASAIVLAAPAHAATIGSEDFETGASGWSDNKTEDPGANSGGFTRHLGRHGAGATTSKTFTLTGTQSSVTVAFDFYRLDSWDGEFFSATFDPGLFQRRGPHKHLPPLLDGCDQGHLVRLRDDGQQRDADVLILAQPGFHG
jgi:opacity protein-like surface antigen